MLSIALLFQAVIAERHHGPPPAPRPPVVYVQPQVYGGLYYQSWPYTFNVSPAPARIGQIKLHTKVKDADVFINGAYAGKSKIKSYSLLPGTYLLELRGSANLKQKVFIQLGKTLDLYPQ